MNRHRVWLSVCFASALAAGVTLACGAVLGTDAEAPASAIYQPAVGRLNDPPYPGSIQVPGLYGESAIRRFDGPASAIIYIRENPC